MSKIYRSIYFYILFYLPMHKRVSSHTCFPCHFSFPIIHIFSFSLSLSIPLFLSSSSSLYFSYLLFSSLPSSLYFSLLFCLFISPLPFLFCPPPLLSLLFFPSLYSYFSAPSPPLPSPSLSSHLFSSISLLSCPLHHALQIGHAQSPATK